MSDSRLVIVPCGAAKVWDSHPDAGPTAARDVYRGVPYRLNREYAEAFGDAWLILSAKYGFIAPDFVIAEPYNVTFKRRSSGPIAVTALRDQVRANALDRFHEVIALGGKDYRRAVEGAFEGLGSRLTFPFAGLSLGRGLAAVRRSIDSGDPLAVHVE